MKKLLALFSMLVLSMTAFAQDDKGILPPVGQKEGTFSEWRKVEVTFKDGHKATFEYRIAFSGKNAMACNYVIEVKNTSTENLEVAALFSYHDKLVNRDFKESVSSKVKPGKTTELKIVTQGCKKEKDKEQSDLEHCLACSFSYSITAVE